MYKCLLKFYIQVPYFNQDEPTSPELISMTFSDPASRTACKTQSNRISQKTATCVDSIVQVTLPTQTGFYDAAEKSTMYCAKLFFCTHKKHFLYHRNLLSFPNLKVFQWHKEIIMFIDNFGDFRLSKVPSNLVHMDRRKFLNRYNGLQLSLNSLSFAFAKESL